jgi:hypothetical protein
MSSPAGKIVVEGTLIEAEKVADKEDLDLLTVKDWISGVSNVSVPNVIIARIFSRVIFAHVAIIDAPLGC